MKRLLSAFGLVVACLLTTQTASALSIDPGRLIRSPENPAVYYAAGDRRYAFPNERIFRSWGVSFDAVQTVTANRLAEWRLAGVIVYRPGRLIKIDTDPKVYLVTENGVLRWIETESVARALFGDGWARQVEDIPDAFLTSYSFGPSIGDAATITLPAMGSGGSLLAIGLNQGLMQNPDFVTSTVPTTTNPTIPASQPDILVRASLPNGVRAKESVRIDVFGREQVPERVAIRINDAPVQECQRQAVCTYTLTHQTQSSVTGYQVQVDASFANGTRRTQALTIPVRDPLAGALRLNMTQTEMRSPGSLDIEAEWGETIIGARSITLTVNGEDQRICFNATTCRISYGVTGAVGSTLSIGAIAEDTSGHRWVTPTSTVTIVANDRPTITVGTSAGTAFTGETITINADANDVDAIAFIEIWENNERKARCERTVCTYTTTPLVAAGTRAFRVIAQDLLGARREVALEPILVLPAIR